jgi:hypothetical protein
MCVWEEGENVESKAFILNNKIPLIEYIESQLQLLDFGKIIIIIKALEIQQEYYYYYYCYRL